MRFASDEGSPARPRPLPPQPLEFLRVLAGQQQRERPTTQVVLGAIAGGADPAGFREGPRERVPLAREADC